LKTPSPAGPRVAPCHVSLNILSLDLDWFNAIETSELPSYLRYFFESLRARCMLPKSVAIMTEHQYLYPWCLRLRRLKHAKMVNVVNMEEVSLMRIGPV